MSDPVPLPTAAKDFYYNRAVLGIPTFGAVSIEFMERLMFLGRPMNMNLELKYIKGQEVGAARNEVVEYALKTQAGYVFFVDDDVLIPAHAFCALMGRLAEFTDEKREEKGKNIVGGVYFCKGHPIWPLVFTDTVEPCDQSWYGQPPHLRECLFTGMGCTLIPTQAFRDVEPPWFVTPNDPNPADPMGPMIRGTEDAVFCAKARAAGWRIWADTGVQCYHLDFGAQKFFGMHPQGLPGEFDMRAGEWTFYPPIGATKAGPEAKNLAQIAADKKPKRKHRKKVAAK